MRTYASVTPTPSRRELLGGLALVPFLGSAFAASAADSVDWARVRSQIVDVISDKASPGGVGERGPTIGEQCGS